MIYIDDIVTAEPEGPKEEHTKNQKIDFFQYLIFDEKYKKASFNNQNRNNVTGNNNNNWKSNEKDEFLENCSREAVCRSFSPQTILNGPRRQRNNQYRLF